ncbi:GGDEF domain-containing protein [Thiomicrorhabdus sp. zzn3]|uniref:GGDEF domain-containing protein n=1 Tax=Thiomicrorhabdus sp. zzn3 TaxID=3039775 RepID=UPI00243658BA|nr:GGDEF domain-containing protein [Thiomicrorhabdus sp. zzn3]MDG6778610.1 GGDEF domain-containing protein [Thiomicrorhabdus sp. zzn3]
MKNNSPQNKMERLRSQHSRGEDLHRASRLFLSKILLSTVVAVLFGFVLFHYFYTGNMAILSADLVALMITALLLLDLFKRRNCVLTGHVASIAVLLFFPVYMHLNQNQDFGLLWLMFVPFVIVALNGWQVGVRYLLVFYAVVFSLAYYGIDHWQQSWSELSFVRLVIASIWGAMIAVVVDMTHSRLNEQIQLQRNKEQRYMQELQRLSTTDGLTKLYNRHYFNKVVVQKLAEYKNSELYLVFFILDIDQFKLYNDYFGHDKGDEALKKVAKTVRNYIRRREDLVFRLGGEEFAGLLFSENPHESAQWVAQMVQEIASLKIEHAPDASKPYLTISMGIHFIRLNQLRSFRTLYSMTDKALYQAKHLGRNQVVISQSEPSSSPQLLEQVNV